MFTTSRQLSLSYTIQIQSMYHPSLTLPCRQIFPDILLSSGFTANNDVCISLPFHARCILQSFHPPWTGHLNSMRLGVQTTKLLIMQFPSVSSYFLPLGPKCLPQYPVLEDPQPIFFFLCKRPIFISIYNSRENYNYIYII